MSLDTTAINQQMTHFDEHESVWLFGYGSLIFKPDFPFMERCPATISGWARCFWQGSHDHRGTPDAPGRVVTLIEQSASQCGGMAYLITPDVFRHLDYREKNGYLRRVLQLDFVDGRREMGLVYLATADNAAFLGPASDVEIAAQIANARGPSGANSEYLLNLAQALRELGLVDEHVFALERELRLLHG